MSARAPKGVLLDAAGTLLTVEPRPDVLRRRLAADGVVVSLERVAAALRTEIAHYRENHLRGRDAETLRALRLECAEVLGSALGGVAESPQRLADHLMASIDVRPAEGALDALALLRRAGTAVAVVSNWDVGLTDVLDALGLGGLVDAVVTSAEVGVAKPDPGVFLAALDRIGVRVEDALHVGDREETDVAGARAAGIRSVLVGPDGGLRGIVASAIGPPA